MVWPGMAGATRACRTGGHPSLGGFRRWRRQLLQSEDGQQVLELLGLQAASLADHLHLKTSNHQQGAALAALFGQLPSLRRLLLAANVSQDVGAVLVSEMAGTARV